jgi:hypothetical protein
MQKRRRRQKPPVLTPVGEIIGVPEEFWSELRELDPDAVCRRAWVAVHPPRGFRVPFLNLELWVDLDQRCLRRRQAAQWRRIAYPLLELVILVYLRHACDAVLTQEMISVNDLKDAHFFQGPHQLKTAPVVELFGWDSARFARAAESIGGKAVDLADLAYALPALPKIPLYYLLWEGDDEFEPNASILFDRSIQSHLNADAIWGLVNLVTDFLLTSD